MNGEVAMMFADSWVWLIFVVIGLIFASVELFIGIETGLDLVFIGSAFVVGGLVTWPFHSWVLTVVVVGVISIAYLVLGRKYIHRWTAVRQSRTNVDAIIGKQGVVLRSIPRNDYGLVKVGYEQWRARADVEIDEGSEIIVTGISGATLDVKKAEGGN